MITVQYLMVPDLSDQNVKDIVDAPPVSGRCFDELAAEFRGQQLSLLRTNATLPGTV